MRHKLSRALRSPNAHYQIGSILLLLTQSFVAPIIIGLASFGSQVLFLAPLLLCQALFESASQAEMNEGQRDGGVASINVPTILLPGVVLTIIALVLNDWISDRPLWLAGAVIAAYFTYTVLLAFAFASSQSRLCAQANFGLCAGYAMAFAASLRYAPGYELITANIVAFGAGAIILAFNSKCRFTLEWGRPHFGAVLASASYKLPIICFNSLTTVLLGLTGASASTIGQFRIVLSAINAGRYFNIVPLAKIQAEIHRRSDDLAGIAKQYLASFLAFQVAMVTVFPEVYSFLFGDREFTRIAVYFASLFILLQPLTYAAFRRAHLRPGFNAMMSIGVATALVTVFALSLGWAEPTMAMAVASVAAVSFYAAIVFSSSAARP